MHLTPKQRRALEDACELGKWAQLSSGRAEGRTKDMMDTLASMLSGDSKVDDLSDRLRRWTIDADASPVCDLLDEAADEIDRLRLTEAEREAVESAVYEAESHQHAGRAATLRGLLERLSSSPSISGAGNSAETGSEPEPAIQPEWLSRP